MRWRIETLDRELGKTKRGKRAFEGLKEGSIRGAKECALEVTEQKRLEDWDSYVWLLAQVYAHVVILMKVVGDEAENRKDWVGMDEFEEIFMGDERVNITDDPRLPALLREWNSSITKIARVNLDLLNMIIGIDGKENLKKVPSFCGELMREVEKMYGFHHKDEYDLSLIHI